MEAPNRRTRCSRRVANSRRVGVVAGFFFVVSRARAYHDGVTEDAKIVVEGVGIGWSGVGRGARLDDRGARVDVPRARRGGDRHLVAHASNLVGIHRALGVCAANLEVVQALLLVLRGLVGRGRWCPSVSGVVVRVRRGRGGDVGGGVRGGGVGDVAGRAPGIERAVRARGGELGDAGREGPRAGGLFGGGVVHPAVEPGDGGAAEPRGDGGGDEVARESGRRRENIARGRRVRGEVARGAARAREAREKRASVGVGAPRRPEGVAGETLRRKTADSASEHARRGVRDDGSGDEARRLRGRARESRRRRSSREAKCDRPRRRGSPARTPRTSQHCSPRARQRRRGAHPRSSPPRDAKARNQTKRAKRRPRMPASSGPRRVVDARRVRFSRVLS